MKSFVREETSTPPGSDWLKNPLGQYLLSHEKAIYDQNITDIFGFNALQIGMLEMDLLQQSRMPKCIHVDSACGDVVCESNYLPFASSTIDLVCMPHVLEFSEDPHQTLREVERVLVPEGHLVLTGFNPMSMWGLRRRLSRCRHTPWCGRNLTLGRIKDWLALLGLEYVSGGHAVYVIPINDDHWIARQKHLANFGAKFCPMVGGIYYLVAKKRVANMHLLKPNWKKSIVKSGLVVSSQKSRPVNNKKTNQNK
ncbi:MAG: class I SAM-dependent methyltransferase [Methylophilus sp.]|nr:class I SAM-dependent methyltransferase [Methylophilus sp.]